MGSILSHIYDEEREEARRHRKETEWIIAPLTHDEREALIRFLDSATMPVYPTTTEFNSLYRKLRDAKCVKKRTVTL